MKQILTYAAIAISLPFMVTVGAISGFISGGWYVVNNWPEQLYNMLNKYE
tara:strand:+ start:1636 stop:1785 length:150 start_codon:yes stop_codon:yes gene_type:complete